MDVLYTLSETLKYTKCEQVAQMVSSSCVLAFHKLTWRRIVTYYIGLYTVYARTTLLMK